MLVGICLLITTSLAFAQTWIWPVPASHTITQGRDCNSSHNGIDIKAGEGADVRATRAGTVVMSADTPSGTSCFTSGDLVNKTDGMGKVYFTYNGSTSYVGAAGKFIVIDHHDGTFSHYDHLSARYVETGAVVTAGQRIGAVGQTGCATGPHLHFTIRNNPFGDGGENCDFVNNLNNFVDFNAGWLDVNGLVDPTNGILSPTEEGGTLDYGTFDVWIKGPKDSAYKKVADQVSDYCQELESGTKYRVDNIWANAGCTFNKNNSSSLEGTIGNNGAISKVLLRFTASRPMGYLDLKKPNGETGTHGTSRGVLHLYGWAVDTNHTNRNDVLLEIYLGNVNGNWEKLGSVTSNGITRTDVAEAYPRVGSDKGFELDFPVSQRGTYTYIVYAVGFDNSSTIPDYSYIGEATVTITADNPYSISLNKSYLTLNAGKSETLSVSYSPSDTVNKNVTWVSSDASVAMVDSNGKVTALKSGTATITVRSKGNSQAMAACKVTVTGTAVTGIKLSSNYIEIPMLYKVGETIYSEEVDVSAAISPSNASDKTVIWYTDWNHARLNGLSSSGNTNIDGNLYYIYRVPNDTEIVKLRLVTGPLVPFTIGETFKLIVKDGSERVSDTATVKIVSAIKSIDIFNEQNKNIAQTTQTVAKGKTIQLSAAANPSYNPQTFTWKSSNTSVATVDSTGKVKMVGTGTVTITATSTDGGGKSNWVKLTNAAYFDVSGYLDGENNTSLLDYGTVDVNIDGVKKYDDKNDVYLRLNPGQSWSVTDIKANPGYTYGGVYEGSESGVMTERYMLVRLKFDTIKPTAVTLNKTSISLVKGKTTTLTATVTPADAKNKAVTWSSSNSNVATVSSTGVVTAKAAGTATITATADGDNSVKATCKITVKSSSSTCIPGDLNGDGSVTGKDLMRLQRYLVDRSVELHCSGDLNGDGSITGKDLMRLQRYLVDKTVVLY